MPRKLNEQKFCGWCATEVIYKSEWMSECPGCGYRRYFNLVPCNNVIITNGEKVLLLERAIEPRKGTFNLPGGFMDMTDTSMETAALREIEEEVGLKEDGLSPLHYFGSGVHHTYNWQDSFIPCVCFFYTTELRTKREIVIDQSESTRIRWVRKEDLQNIDFAFDIDKKMLAKYFKEA
jgi:NAD+ diphosphatase